MAFKLAPFSVGLFVVGLLFFLSIPGKEVEDIAPARAARLSRRCMPSGELVFDEALSHRYAAALLGSLQNETAASVAFFNSTQEVCVVEDDEDLVGFYVPHAEGKPLFALAQRAVALRDGETQKSALVRLLRGLNGTDARHISARDPQLQILRHVVPGSPTSGSLVSVCYVTGTLAPPSVSFEDPFAAEQVAYIQFTVDRINAAGIDVNGTRHLVQLIEYDDAGIPELTDILSALCADYNMSFVGFVIGNNLGAVTVAEELQQPTVNGEGNLVVPLVFPRGLNWTVSIAPSPLQFAIPCLLPLEEAGARSVVWAAVGTLAGLGSVLNETIALFHLNMTVDSYVTLNTTLMSSQQATSAYLDPFIDQWQALNGGTGPDLIVYGGTDDQQTEWIVTAFRVRGVTTGFKPRAEYIYNVLNDEAFRNVTTWMTQDAITDSPYSVQYNWTSFVFGDTQNYERLVSAEFGSTGNDGFRPVNVAALELIPQIYERAGTLDKHAVRAAMHSSVGNPFQTILGPIQIGPTGVPTKSLQFCWQQQDTGSTVLTPLTTPSLANSRPLSYPSLIPYTQAFIGAHTPPTEFQSTGWKILTIALCVTAGCAAAVIIAVVFRKYYHLACLDKTVQGDTWD